MSSGIAGTCEVDVFEGFGECGLASAVHRDGVLLCTDHAREIAERWLELKAKATPPGNVFGWCWEHADLDSQDRDALMRIAFQSVGEPHPTVHPLMLRNTDPYSVGRLIEAGYLGYDGEDQGISFPAYQKWLTEHEVAW